jgi:hypothetical protein
MAVKVFYGGGYFPVVLSFAVDGADVYLVGDTVTTGQPDPDRSQCKPSFLKCSSHFLKCQSERQARK